MLTNLLKDMISYRHLNVMQETYLVNLIKHDMCCVASDFYEYLERAKCARCLFPALFIFIFLFLLVFEYRRLLKYSTRTRCEQEDHRRGRCDARVRAARLGARQAWLHARARHSCARRERQPSGEPSPSRAVLRAHISGPAGGSQAPL